GCGLLRSPSLRSGGRPLAQRRREGDLIALAGRGIDCKIANRHRHLPALVARSNRRRLLTARMDDVDEPLTYRISSIRAELRAGSRRRGSLRFTAAARDVV